MSTKPSWHHGFKTKFVLDSVFTEQKEDYLGKRRCTFCSEMIVFNLNSEDVKLLEHIENCKKLTKEELNKKMLENLKEKLTPPQDEALS